MLAWPDRSAMRASKDVHIQDSGYFSMVDMMLIKLEGEGEKRKLNRLNENREIYFSAKVH